MKQSAIVICPGRGTYNKPELGYLKKHHSDKADFINSIDAYRKGQGQVPISELDEMPAYKMSTHTRGDNASALIYACTVADFMSINRDKYDIVGITGNSMGWYLALACGNSLAGEDGIHVVNLMGTTMHNDAEGGQVIYPLVDVNWVEDAELIANLKEAVKTAKSDPRVEIYSSIKLGGMVIIAANDLGMKRLLKLLPQAQERYPFSLPNHGAFHSPLMTGISKAAKQSLKPDLFGKPDVPLIDGRGHIWQPYSTDIAALQDYTLGHQILETYDYTKAIEVALKEFAPEKLIVLGPGNTLGAPTAQCLIRNTWDGINNKKSFIDGQAKDPFILSMGMEDQRALVLG